MDASSTVEYSMDQAEISPGSKALASALQNGGYDITSEAKRFYTFANGNVFTIVNPVALYITANGSHRVVDANGVTHRPERGYVGISWEPQPGAPAFDF